ncbi:MAG: glycosyltransferase [Deltaproteobacteria bacterium]
MRFLFISRHFPSDLRTSVHGVYKRMGMFIEAIKDFAGLDMLFYVPEDQSYSQSQISDLEESFSKHWEADIKLFLCSVSEFNDKTELSKWLSFGAGIINFHRQKGYFELSGQKQVQALEECLERKPDAIFAHRLSSMCPLLLTKKILPPIFFDLDDIEHIVLERYIGQQKKLHSKLLYLLLPELRSGESNAVNLADETYVCSEKDRSYLMRKFRNSKIVTVPNAVKAPGLQDARPGQTLLFIGSDYKPNIEAANFLVESIWPHVHREIPDAKLIIAGIARDKLNRDIAEAEGLEITGFVDDLDNVYRRSRIVTIPILVGGGTRYKIIEAASYGKPIVSTATGAEGIELSHETEIIIRDSPEEFAEACIQLLKDSTLCEKIGIKAREKAIRYYDRNNVIRLIRQHILDCLK